MSLAASLSVDEAARRTWDAVVVGAGPAGAMATRELACRGAAVLLVDQASFPRGKVCGCCLNGRALAALRAAGLEQLIRQCGAVSLNAVCLAAGGRSVRLRVPGGVALSRQELDAALVRAALAAGAAFLPQARAALPADSLAARREVRQVELHWGGTGVRVEARCVLAADGLGGKLLARAGIGSAPPEPGSRIGVGIIAPAAPDFYQPGTIYLSCGAHGYLGLVRLEDARLDLAAAIDREWLRSCGGAAVAAGRLVQAAGWPAIAGLEQLAWRGTAALTRHARCLAAERLFVLGDAAGYVEPFTGEGMAWALASARVVAPLALQAARGWQPGLARSWAVRYRRVVLRRQLACRVAAALLRRPLLSRGLVRLLGRVPSLAGLFVRLLDSPGPEGSVGIGRQSLPSTLVSAWNDHELCHS
jgi:flavin-dependent dehydrogenase